MYTFIRKDNVRSEYNPITNPYIYAASSPLCECKTIRNLKPSNVTQLYYRLKPKWTYQLSYRKNKKRFIVWFDIKYLFTKITGPC